MSEHPWNSANITFISLSSLYNSFKTYMDFVDFQYSLNFFFSQVTLTEVIKRRHYKLNEKKFKLSFCQILIYHFSIQSTTWWVTNSKNSKFFGDVKWNSSL